VSTRLRRLLPAFALAAALVVSALTVPLVAGAFARNDDPAPAAFRPPHPQRDPATRPAPPTPGERVARIAVRAVGIPYRWGGASPSGGFDCSGLVHWAYKHVGVELPHSSYALYGRGRRVSRSHLRPGDVLFFSGLGHVGLYLGGGRMVHAPYSGRLVEIVRLRSSHYGRRLVAVRRFLRS
jgi:cell wall-associated NlpC family hydrolase